MIEISRVGADDWARYRDIRLRALADSPGAFGSTYAREAAFDGASWRSRTETAAVFFALVGDEPVGLAAGFHDREGCAADERLLVSMWIAPQHRGEHVAGRLVDVVARWALDDGASALLLEVAATNAAARAAYLRAGFTYTGVSKPMPRDPGIVEVSMRLELS